MTISIDLKLFATLQKFSSRVPQPLRLENGSCVRDVLLQFGIPTEKAKLIFINNVKVNLDAVLQDGDRLGIFPPVGGG